MKSKNQLKIPDWRQVLTFKQAILMLLGVAMAVFALRGFMIPNGFLDGGLTGVSLLFHEMYHINFSVLVLPLNLIFLLVSYRFAGKIFAMRSLVAVLLLAIGVEFIHIEPITSDKLLIAIFGGCFIGLGMGLVVRSGAALDGFEILALYTTRRTGFSMSEVILFFNGVIFLTAAIKFGIESAMYSLITYFAALKMADYVVDGIEEFISLTIISRESDQIKSLLVNQLGKGITVYKGERGYLPGSFHERTDCDVIVTIVTRLELMRIQAEIMRLDDRAFMYTHTIREAQGGILKRRPHH